MADKHKQIEIKIIQDWTRTGRGRLFHNRTGSAWLSNSPMKSATVNGNRAGILMHPFKISYGLDIGSSDLIGWEYREYLGINGLRVNVPVFCSIEVKTKAHPNLSDEQKNWLNNVVSTGGLGDVAMEIDDGYDMIKWSL